MNEIRPFDFPALNDSPGYCGFFTHTLFRGVLLIPMMPVLCRLNGHVEVSA